MTSEMPACSPCPKCGGTVRIGFCLHPGTAYMQHEECKFMGPEVKVLKGMPESDIERRAIEAWNNLSPIAHFNARYAASLDRIAMEARIEAVKALDGKLFAMLTPEEEATLNFFRDVGRKFGVAVQVISEADPAQLDKAPSQLQADQILKRTNSRVSVTVS